MFGLLIILLQYIKSNIIYEHLQLNSLPTFK